MIRPRITIGTWLVMLALVAGANAAADGAQWTDRQIDGLLGPVKSAATEVLHADSVTGKLWDIRESVESATYDPHGSLIERRTNSVDFIDVRRPERVDAQTVVLRSAMGDRTERRIFDSSGRLAEVTTFLGAGTSGEIYDQHRYKYSRGRVIEDDSIEGGKVSGFTLTECDRSGAVTREEYHYNGDKPPYPFALYRDYRFDQRGNWIRRSMYEFERDKGKLVLYGIFVRTITYYGDSPASSPPPR